MNDAKPIDISIGISSKLDVNGHGPMVNKTIYRGIIGSLLYLAV